MRTWSVVGKYAVSEGTGVITHTDITIVSTSNGYAIYTERILGDQRLKTDQELIELARDAYFKREYADRAMAEAVQTVDELKLKTQALDKWREAAEERMATAEDDRKARFDEAMTAITQTEGALIEFMTNVAPHLMALLPAEVLEAMEAGNEPTAVDETEA